MPRQSLVSVKIAVRRVLQPVDERRHQILLVLRHRPVTRGKELAHGPEAEIVAAPLQQRHLKSRSRSKVGVDSGRIQYFQRPRNVRPDQLGLEVPRRGGDDDGGVIRPRPEDRGHEIRERFADARPRLDHQVLARVERADDGAGHVNLAGTFLVAGHRPERAALAEMLSRGLDIKLRAVLMRRKMPLTRGLPHLGDKPRPIRIVDELGRRHRGHPFPLRAGSSPPAPSAPPCRPCGSQTPRPCHRSSGGRCGSECGGRSVRPLRHCSAER